MSCSVWSDKLFVTLAAQIGDSIRKTPSAHYASEVGDFMQSFIFRNILNGNLHIDASIAELF